MATIRINNTNTNVIEMNESASETIIILHGMFTNLSIFYYKIAPKLAEKFHVVLYDLKGHGLSEVMPSGYDFQSMSDDLLALMEALKIEKAHLAGYSYGGLVALYTAMFHPEKTGKVAAIESPNSKDNELHNLLENYSKASLEQYLNNIYVTTLIKPSRRLIEKDHKQFDYLLNNTSLIDDITKNWDFFYKIKHANITNETLLLYGKDSPCKEAGKSLHQYIRNSQLFLGEGDHNLPLQSPDWVAEKLYDYYTTG